MTRTSTLALTLAACAGLARADGLLEARRGHETTLTRKERHEEPLEPPPEELFSLVRYRGPLGEMAAYQGTPPGPGKHPAIIWITGGFPAGGIGPSAWEPVSPDNDQSAKVYRQAGLVMMYPTLRGSFGNPGTQECFYGEVDDVLAALEHLRQVDYVDPERIYLGGHSTGGTLALLVAAATGKFKAVIAFGPIDDPLDYGSEVLPYDPGDARESRLRAPIHYLDAITSPTFVIEGSDGNIEALRAMAAATKNPKLRFLTVEGSDHFEILAPVNRLIAGRLSGAGALSLSAAEASAAVTDQRASAREADDLGTLAQLRRAGAQLDSPCTVRHFLLAREERPLEAAARAAKKSGFEPQELQASRDDEGRPFFVLVLKKRLTLQDLRAVFATSAAVAALSREHELYYDGWDVE